MRYQLFLLVSIFLMNPLLSSAQGQKALLSFYYKFDPITFDRLHVYTDGPQKEAMYNLESTYPFKGKSIELGALAPLVEKLLEVDPEHSFFAVARYPIQAKLEGLILRVYDEDFSNNAIYNLVYNIENNTLIQVFLLAHDYHSEGGSGATQSWILDLNQDLVVDVLTRSYYDRYEMIKHSDDLKHIHEESSHLNIYKSIGFDQTIVNHKSLQQRLEKNFPYRPVDAATLEAETQQEILQFLKKGGLLVPSETD